MPLPYHSPMLAHIKSKQTVLAEELTPEAFNEFGGVISSPHQLQTAEKSSANYGTAVKLYKVSPIECDLSQATANWNMFRCSPPLHLIDDHQEIDQGLTYFSKVLERHPHSTQTFVPMGRDAEDISYMVIVAPNDMSTCKQLPLISKLRAFICKGNQAVTYGKGVWHAPMIALNKVTDFAVLIHETGINELDCEEVEINANIEFALETNDTSKKRKDQTTLEFEDQLNQYQSEGPPIVKVKHETGDKNFDMKQLKYEVERLYYLKDYDGVCKLVNKSKVDGKLKSELEDIAERARRHAE